MKNEAKKFAADLWDWLEFPLKVAAFLLIMSAVFKLCELLS